MTVANTPAQALEQFRAARSQWQTHLSERQDAETVLNTPLTAGENTADYTERVPQLRERWTGRLTAPPARACMRSGLCSKPAQRTHSAILWASTARR